MRRFRSFALEILTVVIGGALGIGSIYLIDKIFPFSQSLSASMNLALLLVAFILGIALFSILIGKLAPGLRSEQVSKHT